MIKTVSLNLAKQLKEAGFPQETYLYWRFAGNLGFLYRTLLQAIVR